MNVTPITQSSSKLNFGHMTPQERKKTQEDVAVGAGGAAGITATATKMASKKGLKSATEGEKILQEMMGDVKRTANAVNQTSKTATGLFARFKSNVKMYSADIMKRLNQFKNSKYIGPIVNSPITKKLSMLAGGVLAFFVLATGVNKAINNGSVAVNDLKNQYETYRNS